MCLRRVCPEQPLLTPIRIRISDAQSPPSASITATSRSTRPGSCADRRSLVNPNASDSASVSPARSANSTSNATPACDTNPSPSAVTSTVPKRSPTLHHLDVLWVEVKVGATLILTAREDIPSPSDQPLTGGSRLAAKQGWGRGFRRRCARRW